MSIQTPKQVALEFLSAIREKNMDRIDSLLADDGSFWVIGELPSLSGEHNKEQFMGAISTLFEIMEGPPTINPKIITEEDDRVSVVAEGEMVTKTGVPYCNTYHFLITARDGQIFRHREYFDTQLVARVFGLG